MRGYSQGTIEQYLLQVKLFARHFNLAPDLMGQEEINDYLYYLKDTKEWSSSSIIIAHAALRFFYETTLERPWTNKRIPTPKGTKRLPVVLDQTEVRKIIEVSKNLKHKTIIATAYSGGLRLGEIARLKVNDIDSKRMQIRINQGKGKRDRYTILSKAALSFLREYWQLKQPKTWLFEGAKPGQHMTGRGIQLAFSSMLKKTGIKKKASFHTLRHSFATHMLESGVNLENIKIFLGHRSIKSTSIYLHVQKRDFQNIISPLDHFWPGE